MDHYGQGNHVLILFGKKITQFGESDDPVKIAPIDDKGVLKRGFGGTAVRGSRINPGETLIVAVMPGGADSAFLSGKLASNSEASGSWIVIGTGEGVIFEEGICKTVNEIGRGGMIPSDDVYVFEFNKSIKKLGAK